MYDDTKFCVKWIYEKMTSVTQDIGVRQGCSLSPYLSNIFIDYIIWYISDKSIHAPIGGKQTIPSLLFADDLALGSFTANSLQKGSDQMAKIL
jgi:hypothetical protein